MMGRTSKNTHRPGCWNVFKRQPICSRKSREKLILLNVKAEDMHKAVVTATRLGL